MTLRRIKVFLSLPPVDRVPSSLNIIDSLITAQFNLFGSVNKCPENALKDLTLLRTLTRSQAKASLTLGVRHVGKIKKISQFTGSEDKIVAQWWSPVAKEGIGVPKENNDIQAYTSTQLVQEVAFTTIIRRDVVPQLNNFTVSYNMSTNYSNILYKVTPLVSKYIASKPLPPVCMVAGSHLLYNGVPDNLCDTSKFGGKVCCIIYNVHR